jgi:hypothetical protein
VAVLATAVWRARPSGVNTNGGGYDPGISGAATDYSQQNAAQASGTHGTTIGTTTFTDATALAFTSAMIGNAVYITGSGQTTGWYFVTAFTSSSVVTLDRSPGTGTLATWHLGGGWADFWTNTTSSGPGVPGNIVYILGGASPSYGAPDYSPSTFFTPVNGSTTSGNFSFIGDPNTPSGNGYSGLPLIQTQGLLFYNSSALVLKNLFIVAGSSSFGYIVSTTGPSYFIGFILDQNGYDISLISNGTFHAISCEVYSSQNKRTTNANYAFVTGAFGSDVVGCNIHDCIGPAISLANIGGVTGNIIAKCGGTGINIAFSGSNYQQNVKNNTIDGNLGSGIVFATQEALQLTTCLNNIISNHTQSGTYGMTVSAGTTAANNLVKGFVDYNTFYNNTTDLNSIGYGAHDTSNSGSAPNLISATPYVASSTENYTLA